MNNTSLCGDWLCRNGFRLTDDWSWDICDACEHMAQMPIPHPEYPF